MGVSVVIAGQVRDPSGFAERLELLSELRDEGTVNNIIFSTWLGELDEHQGLEALLKSKEVHVILSRAPELLLDYETNPPPPKSVTILQQIKAVRLGIEQAPHDDWVIRTRPDAMPGRETLTAAISSLGSSPVNPPAGWPRLFEERVVVSGGLCFQPMFLVDNCFIGRRDDLRKLVHPHIYAQLFGLRLNCEQHLYATPFLDQFPVLGQFFQLNAGMQHGDQQLARSLQDISLHDPFFQRTLAMYYLIVGSYFQVGFDSADSSHEALRFDRHIKGRTFDEFIADAERGLVDGVSFFEPGNTMYFSRSYWIDALQSRKFRSSPVGNAIADSMENMTSLEAQRPYDQFLVKTAPDAVTYRDKLYSLNHPFAVYACDFPVEEAGKTTIPGRPMQASIVKS